MDTDGMTPWARRAMRMRWPPTLSGLRSSRISTKRPAMDGQHSMATFLNSPAYMAVAVTVAVAVVMAVAEVVS
jgi:hypothetical protein